MATSFLDKSGLATFWSKIKTTFALKSEIPDFTKDYVTPEDYGAVGDGTTDDTSAVQAAMNASNNVHFTAGKTYYLASTVTVSKDIELHGNGATIKTVTPSGGTVNDGIVITGTLKDTTTLTSDYYTVGTVSDDNASNRLTLEDMSNVEIGDIIVIKATDQYYSYSRQYYYLGGTFKVVDIYDGHIYLNRNMPFDISLTNSVSVYVYSAPIALVDNLSFISDLNTFGQTGTYPALLTLSYCKDSVIQNCDLSYMKVGVSLLYDVNVLIDNVQMNKSRYSNASSLSDGYGVYVYSDTNTVIKRIVSLCSQGCVDMSGDIPNFDTYIKECGLSSECRTVGLDMHDNSYNLVVEDCVVGGLSLYGTAVINRCHFVRNYRASGSTNYDDFGISFRGSHDPRWARLLVSNCVFDENVATYLTAQSVQSSIQAIDSIIDTAVFEHCRGGRLVYNPAVNSYILSNTLNELRIIDWQDCYEFYHTTNGTVKKLIIQNCTFTNPYYINAHTAAITTDGIYNAVVQRAFPAKNVLLANVPDTYGERYSLPEGVAMTVSSDDAEAEYITCGINIASDDSEDYSVGSVTATVGSALVRTANATYTAFLSDDGLGNLIYALPSGYSTSRPIYPNYMVRADADEEMLLTASAIVKNTGSTTGTSFRMYIAIINPETGYVTYSGHGNYGVATADGLTISHSRPIPKGYAAFWYLYSYDVVAGSETKVEDLMVSITSYDCTVPSYTSYTANKRTGDGTLLSIAGQNNIMGTSETFNIEFSCDYAASSGGTNPSATGVSF